MQKILFIGFFVGIFFNASAQDVNCKSLAAQTGFNLTRMMGTWNMVKTSVPGDTNSCVRAEIIDLFREADKYMIYFRYPEFDEFLNPSARFYGLKIQNDRMPGVWAITKPEVPIDFLSQYILHTDYNTALAVTCAQFDGESMVTSVGMFSRGKFLNGEIAEAYEHLLNTFGITGPFYDVSHDSCPIGKI